ncbi:MAG TPA: tRNA (adenosine(37)-N6)-threonylcarbamoyltransferase complex ATPase subunit type 1 TsaE [Candidatus Paceibacterota bacterium]
MLFGSHTISRDDLPSFAGELLRELKTTLPSEGALVVALHGDLGAGKTTLVQTLGARLGITEAITSPTFTIMKHYETTDDVFTTLIHMDAYRIESLTELGPLRFADMLREPHTLVCIEWGEKIQEALPASLIHVTLSAVDETTRTVQVTRA